VRLRKLLGVEKEEVKEVIDEAELREVALALWVVDSNKTKPELEDIYNFSKVHNFEQSKKIIFDELEKRNSTFIYDKIEKPLIPVVDKMQEVGAKIDVAYLKDLSKTYHKELEKISKKITEYAGEEFNIASPKQLGEILFVKMGLKAKNQKKTGTGAFSTKESELEKMADLHPIIAEILKYREYAKLLSTYIDVIPTLVDSEDRVHPKMIQAGAVTGRMASENPSIQNIPNKTDLGRAIRRAFIAEKGYKLVAIDYSQIELRIAAYLSGDEKLLAIFKNKEDVHTAVAAQVFGIDLKDVTKDMRRQAKVINFGVMYGMGVTALQKNLGTDRASAQKFYNEYFEKFSGLATYLEKTKYETAQKGYTETLFGRRRYFEGIRSKLPFIRAAAERMAINAPIQGTEADVIKMAMIKIHEELDVRMLFQVHDELVFEIKEDELAIIPKIQEIMEGIVDFDLTTEARVGDNWEEMK
jgi:DNA polymerase-1